MNFIALLGWAPDGETTIMSPAELVERFTLDRVGSSPATFDYEKLDWMNGVYLRALPQGDYAERLIAYLHEQGIEWPEERVRAAAPLVQEKIERLGQFPEFAGFLFEREGTGRRPVPSRIADVAELDPEVLAGAAETLAELEPFTADAVEGALRALADRLGQKPRQAFQPIRIAVTGSKVSPGLFESIELLGREETLVRIRRANAAAA
jgi:glutamyl-tRNA synthetase